MKKKIIYLLIFTSFLVKFNIGIFGQPPGIIYVDFEFWGYTKRLNYISNPGAPVQGAKIHCSVTIESYDGEVYLHQESYVYSDQYGYYEEFFRFEVPVYYYLWPNEYYVTQDAHCETNSAFKPIESEYICDELGFLCIDFYGFEPSDDSDNNGVPDELELAFAQKFSPQIYGHEMATNISPEPFRIMGGLYNTDIHISLWNILGQNLFYNQSCVNGRVEFYKSTEQKWVVWLPWAGTQYDYHNLFPNDTYTITSPPYTMWRIWNESKTQIIDSGSLGVGTYYAKYNFDWPGTYPTEWRNAYTSGNKSGSLYAHTIYVTIFKVGGCAIQYWFFYPYNDWVNDHEGDTEHINVVTTSLNPNEADLLCVDYYFHHKVKRSYKSELINHNSIVGNTHPKVFTGGYGYYAGFGSGPNSGGSYPWTGYWEDVAGYIIENVNENVNGNGIVVNYTVFSQDNNLYNRQGVEILKDPSYENYNSHPWLSWNSSRINLGIPRIGEFGFLDTYVYSPYHSGGWRQLGACGHWTWYE